METTVIDRVKQTCIEMLNARGFTDIREEEGIIHGNNPTEDAGICVILHTQPKFTVTNVQEYNMMVSGMNMNHYIIVVENPVTPMARKVIDNSIEMTIEVFLVQELVFNITKHELVPKHEKVNAEKALELKKRFGTKFPVLLKIDPVCRFYGFKRGDMIRVVRKNGTIAFRIVG